MEKWGSRKMSEFFYGKCPRKIELLENVLDNLARLSSGIALGYLGLVRLGLVRFG